MTYRFHSQGRQGSRNQVIVNQVSDLYRKHGKSHSFTTNSTDPVNTQLYIHDISSSQKVPTLPSILQRKNSDKKNKPQPTLSKCFNTKPSHFFSCDVECQNKFPTNNQEEPVHLTKEDLRRRKKFIEIDMLTLETNYAMKMKQSINTDMPQVVVKLKKLPQVPSKQKISDFIRNYKPYDETFSLDDMIRNDSFAIEHQANNYLYFGQLYSGTPEGKGIIISKGSIFEGEWHNGKKLKGVEVTMKGMYKGKFINNQRSKVGQFLWHNGEYYSGQWLNNQKHGTGVWKSPKGDIYMGQWNKGKVQGYGTHLSKTGQKFQGFFLNFLKHGKGAEYFPNGDSFQGNFKEGKPNGFGVYEWKSGLTYRGNFQDGYREGKGRIEKQGMFYEGTFQKEKANGKGCIEMSNGDNYRGQFRRGKKEGKGVSREKKKICVGVWHNNKFIFQS